MIPKLKELYTNESIMGLGNVQSELSGFNVDDIFRIIGTKGFEEVEVTREEMYLITLVMVNTVSKVTKEQSHTDAWEALREGKVDKYLGVKLILND